MKPLADGPRAPRRAVAKLSLAIVVACAGLATVGACSRGDAPAAISPAGGRASAAAASAAASASAAPIEVSDDAGRRLRLARPAQRIVAVSPHITELLFAAGAGAAVVGVDAWSDYPAAARALPRVGDLNALDLERIVALKPDLIVIWGHGNSQRQLDVLAALGLPYYIDEPRRLDDIPRSLERLGRLAGRADAAQHAAAQLRQALDELAARARNVDPVAVFYQVWDAPLLTVNDRTLIGDVIRLCGGRNVFGHLPMQAPQLNIEAVLEADPAVILATRPGGGDAEPAAPPGSAASAAGQTLPDAWATQAAAVDPAFALWRRWPRLHAVRRSQLVSLPDDLISRHGPRIVQGARLLCAALEQVRTHSPQADRGPRPAPRPPG
ncbi:MAG: hypothetical protein RIQ60_4053 [Pseudomonadota bacterium]